MTEEKKYIVVDAVGSPIMRHRDEANPFLFYSLREAFKFAEKEIKNQDAVSIVELKEIERFGSGI